MQTQIRPESIATKISYVKTASCLTISVNGRAIFVKDADNKLFDAISSGNIDKECEFLVDKDLNLSQLYIALKISQHQDLIAHNDKLFFASPDGLIEIDMDLARRLIELKEAGQPYYPLLKFWTKFATSVAYTTPGLNLADLFTHVGTPVFPLSWDGSLIAYFRSHKGSLPESLATDPNGSGLAFRTLSRTTLFDPSEEEQIGGRQFDCRYPDGNYKSLYSLANVENLCLDQGSIYEVEVDPGNLTGFGIGRNYRSEYLNATVVTGVRSLGLATTEENQGIIELPVWATGNGLALRDPSTSAANASYLVELAGASQSALDQLRHSTPSLKALTVTGC